MGVAKFKLKWRSVFNALRRLYKDPNDLEAVFIVFDNLSDKAFRRQYERFRKTATGSRVITTSESLVDSLSDMGRLQSMPVGSLGNGYAKFLGSVGYTASQFSDDTKGKAERPSDLGLNAYIKWVRDQHDLTHEVTGYDRTQLGEVLLLWFLHGNATNLGYAVMAIPMALTHAVKKGWGVFPVVWEAYWHGRKARWFGGMDWPAMLELQVEDVRVDMEVREPVRYKALRDKLRKQKGK